MKVIFCPECEDLVKLKRFKRHCLCKKSWGTYKEDSYHCLIGGKAIPIGIGNRLFHLCLMNRVSDGQAPEFKGFVIPYNAKSLTVEE